MAADHLTANVILQIGEVAEQTGLSADAIRFYEKRRLLPRPERSAGRFRLYTKDAIVRVRFIRQMQGLGFSLREIRELIDLRADKVESCESVKRLLRTKLDDIRAKIRELQRLESELLADLRKCERELRKRTLRPAGACPVLEELEGIRGTK